MTSKLFIVGLIIIVKFIYGTLPAFNAPVGGGGGTCLTFAKLFNTGKSWMTALPYAEEKY